MTTHKLKEPVQLMFCVFHERDRQEYPIRIPRSATIFELQKAIQAEYRNYTRVDLFNIKTFKANYLDIHLHDVQLPAGENYLRRGYPVSTYWPDDAEISPDTVNILVDAQAYTGDAMSSRRQDSSSDDDIVLSFEEMSLYQKKVREAVRKGLSSSVPAQPARFASQQAQADIPIFNGRPFQNTGPPIEIYHSVFRKFAQSMQDPIPPTAEDFKRVEQLLSESQALYSSKNDRKSAMKATLSKLLVGSITTEKIAKREADGVIKCQTGIEGLLGYPVILEVEQEIGTAQCDPSIQGAESYTHYWSQNEMAPLRDVSCCPSFIIAIAGPWMCILGAVYLDRVIVQPLTEFMWLARHPQQESRQAHLTQILCALREGLKDARSYYESLRPQVGPDHLRLAPDLRQFPGQDGQAVVFIYTKSLVGQRPVFEARTDSGAIIVVKFVERYNAEAHRMLADKGFAPKLLFDSRNTIGGGVRMIVMEYVSGTDLHQFLSANWIGKADRHQATGSVQRDVEAALQVLHGADLVFGDLRQPNILVVKKESGYGAMLIDFDWCSTEGEGRYPINLNDSDINWPAGVQRGSLMQKQHDHGMFAVLFDDL